jgi:aspartate kinase
MTPGRGRKEQIVVIKIGGSIFKEAKAYRRAASFVLNQLQASSAERYVVVVSAQNGTTDSQERIARRIVACPESRALDLLWSTGELRSVAVLAMHLHALGMQAVGLNVHETGLRVSKSTNCNGGVQFLAGQLRQALSQYSVAVVPGFLATKVDGSIVSIGRGGSDLTAVLLATSLRALRCELVKDVPGYFTSDPNIDKAAQHIPCLTYKRALAMADNGCDLVQRKAIEAAMKANLSLLIRGIDEASTASLISARPQTEKPYGTAAKASRLKRKK